MHGVVKEVHGGVRDAGEVHGRVKEVQEKRRGGRAIPYTVYGWV